MNTKSFYIDNWNTYWKQYAMLNPDLGINGITSKRGLMNHFSLRGWNENRQIEYLEVPQVTIYEQIEEQKQFILRENMFKEKI